jgi:hypothetical protein
VDRRDLLARTALLTAGLSGCVAPSNRNGGTGEGGTAGGERIGGAGTTDTTTSVEGAGIKIESSVTEALTVELTVSRDGSTLHTETVSVPPSESAFADYEITGTGVYRVTVETGSGREGTTQFSVDEYALEHGRNVVIAVTSEIIQGYIQE